MPQLAAVRTDAYFLGMNVRTSPQSRQKLALKGGKLSKTSKPGHCQSLKGATSVTGKAASKKSCTTFQDLPATICYLSKRAILYVQRFSSPKQHTSTIYGKRLIPAVNGAAAADKSDANKRRQPHGLLLDPCRWQYHVQLVPILGIVFN